ncbi:hypothetical protein AB9F29_00220 [Falsihalocynthiibacter sp. S25ZX9]|uniref:hypothetical protein n=1 Tax=Falsihalocynthiibacter sp. S25ZX9 TaxID=3240870 RepID=UPI00350F190D
MNNKGKFNPVEAFESILRGVISDKRLQEEEKEVITLKEVVIFLRHLSPELASGDLLNPVVRLMERRSRELSGNKNGLDLHSEVSMMIAVLAVELLETDMGNDKALSVQDARTRILEVCPKGSGIIRPVRGTASSNSGKQGVVDRAALKRWGEMVHAEDRAFGSAQIKARLKKDCKTHNDLVAYVDSHWERTAAQRKTAQREADI